MRTATARDGRWSRAWDSSCRTSNISLLKANARTGSRKSSKPSGGAGGTRLSHRRVSSRSTSTVRRCSPNRCVPGIRLPRSAPSARQPALEPATLRLRPTRRNGCNGRRRMPHGSTRCTTRLLLRRTPRPGGSFFASLQRSMPTPTRGRSTPTAAGCSPRNSQPTEPRWRHGKADPLTVSEGHHGDNKPYYDLCLRGTASLPCTSPSFRFERRRGADILPPGRDEGRRSAALSPCRGLPLSASAPYRAC